MYKLNIVGVECAEILVQLWHDTYNQAYAKVHSAEDLADFCEQNFILENAKADLSNENAASVIAQKGDKAVGFYLVKHNDCPVDLGEDLDGGSSELKQIYVLADHYGQGLGKMLFEDALIEIMSHGRKWVWLSVADNNKRALAFYAKHDFKAVGTGPTFEVGEDRLPSTIMARRV